MMSSDPFAKVAMNFSGVNVKDLYSPSPLFRLAITSSILFTGICARNPALNQDESACPVRSIVSMRLLAKSTGDIGDGEGAADGDGLGEGSAAAAIAGPLANKSAKQPTVIDFIHIALEFARNTTPPSAPNISESRHESARHKANLLTMNVISRAFACASR